MLKKAPAIINYVAAQYGNFEFGFGFPGDTGVLRQTEMEFLVVCCKLQPDLRNFRAKRPQASLPSREGCDPAAPSD
jgi:hypothetical protein